MSTKSQLGEKRVSDYMTKDVISIDDTALLTVAIRRMDDRRISVLPVVDSQGALIGILSTMDLVQTFHEVNSDLGALSVVNDSTRDFLLQLLMEQGDNTRVCDVMTSPVVTTGPGTNLIVAAQMLTDKKYHHLPIVDDNQQPIGMLSTSDLVRALAEQGARLAG